MPPPFLDVNQLHLDVDFYAPDPSPDQAGFTAYWWNRTFQRMSKFSEQDGADLGGTDGWRTGDLGASIPLPAGRTLWLWGDSYATHQITDPVLQEPRPHVHGIIGSTIAVSDRSNVTRWYGLDPRTEHGVNISTGEGVQHLVDIEPLLFLDFPRAGGWALTFEEDTPDERRLWPAGGIDLDGTLHVVFNEIVNPTPGSDSYAATGRTFIYRYQDTSTDPENWSPVGGVVRGAIELLNKFGEVPHINWAWFVDDRARAVPESSCQPFIYVFGLNRYPVLDQPMASNAGNLYVARVDPSKITEYHAWEFLHHQFSPEASPYDRWVPGDDTPWKLQVLATDVAQEFAVERITLEVQSFPITRWVLTHSHPVRYPAMDLPPDFHFPGGGGTTIFSHIGVIRISTEDSLMTFPTEAESSWVDLDELEPWFVLYSANITAAIERAKALNVEYTDTILYYRGFKAHLAESNLPQLLVGYTIFGRGLGGLAGIGNDCFGENVGQDDLCAPYLNPFCGDHPDDWGSVGDARCGARRFAVIDLAQIWPQPTIHDVFHPTCPTPPQATPSPSLPSSDPTGCPGGLYKCIRGAVEGQIYYTRTDLDEALRNGYCVVAETWCEPDPRYASSYPPDA